MVLDIKDLPQADELGSEKLALLAKTHALLQRVSLHAAEVAITFDDTYLTPDLMTALLGPLYTRLYCNDKGVVMMVPQRLPPRVIRLLGAALSKLSTRLAKAATEAQVDVDQVADNAFSAIINCTTDARRKPY